MEYVIKELLHPEEDDEANFIYSELDSQRRANIQEADQLRSDRNRLSKQVGMLMGQAKKDPSKLEEAEAIKANVKAQGYSLKSYLKLVYGQGMTPALFEEMVTMEEVASHYKQHYQADLTYTTEQLEQSYQENPSAYNVASYEYIYFKGSASSTTDADGNTVQPTEEESAAAKAAAAEAAAAALERYQNGETLLAISKDYEDLGTYSSVDAGSNTGSAMAQWVFDSARTANEGAVVTDDPNSYVVVFHSCGRQEYSSVDVRHILFRVDASSLDKDAETYDADLQALKDEAKAKAEDALAQWPTAARRMPSPRWPTSSAMTAAPTPTAACTPRSCRVRWSPSSTTGASTPPARPATPASSTTTAATSATTSCTSWARTSPPGRCP